MLRMATPFGEGRELLEAARSSLANCEEQLEEYVSTAHTKDKKSRVGLTQAMLASRSQESAMSVSVPFDYDDTSDMFVIFAKIDTLNRLVELSFISDLDIPRMLLKIISLCIPFNPNLAKITLRCGLSGAALYETVNILNTSHVTEIYLDDSRIYEHNFYILLDNETRLQLLSLARCTITDEDCALMIPKLAFPNPASKTLNTLNLSGNLITDEGARIIAQTLRSNRTLLYLNLSGNKICNTGVLEIFSSLMEFPITSEELMLKRKRTFYYVKMRKEVYDKCVKDLMSMPPALSTSDDRSVKRAKAVTTGILRRKSFVGVVDNAYSPEVVATKAEKMTDDLVGSWLDPFRMEVTYCRDNKVYSGGNLTLCYLNIAYNNIGYKSVVKLVEVMRYQALSGKYPNLGLMSVLLDGNPLPECRELAQLSELLARAQQVRLMYADPQIGTRRPKKK